MQREGDNPRLGRMLTTPRASQFERILADVLKISKNLKGEDWVAINYHKEKRKRQSGKETIVYVNGVAQNPKKVQRQATRYKSRTSVHRGMYTIPILILRMIMGTFTLVLSSIDAVPGVVEQMRMLCDRGFLCGL